MQIFLNFLKAKSALNVYKSLKRIQKFPKDLIGSFPVRGDLIKSLFKAVAILTIFAGLTRVLGFLFRVFLSRTLSPELLGVYTIAVSVFLVFATLLNSGLPLTISKFTAEFTTEKNNKKIFATVSAGLIISLILGVVCVLVILFGKGLFARVFTNDASYTLLICLIPAVVSTAVYAPFRGYLWGKEKYLKVSVVEFIEQVIRIITCLILYFFVSNENFIFAAGISLGIACVLSTVLGIVFYLLDKAKLNNPKGFYKPLLKSSSPISAVRLAQSVMQPLIAILIPFRLIAAGYTESQALAQLGIAMGMTVPVLMIPSTIIGSLAMALIPKISSLIKEKTIEIIEKATRYTFRASISAKRPEKSALKKRATRFISKMKKSMVTKPLPAPLRSSLLRAICEEIAIARAK